MEQRTGVRAKTKVAFIYLGIPEYSLGDKWFMSLEGGVYHGCSYFFDAKTECAECGTKVPDAVRMFALCLK